MCRKCVKPLISGKFYCDTSLSYLIICYQFYFLSLTLCETLRFLTPHDDLDIDYRLFLKCIRGISRKAKPTDYQISQNV
ncbi:hypothetical protein T4B_12304 [Trichinella pseudospiralis]|uniref:Uncharacterized protein n=1 Tax=Trichinella pseudospiralis TaxID=6337 RepID=A0A0V1IPC5_TRIPS|nr:hypothetical protein T4A_6428 [Trichinella pseudospiralis]KRZ24617.1 hypothetical protein T4B_12304 [Trichinella pseudospiralis]KRZ36847.1 hypothetical protein T4C_5102 [Trichinella pseudospiralis]